MWILSLSWALASCFLCGLFFAGSIRPHWFVSGLKQQEQMVTGLLPQQVSLVRASCCTTRASVFTLLSVVSLETRCTVLKAQTDWSQIWEGSADQNYPAYHFCPLLCNFKSDYRCTTLCLLLLLFTLPGEHQIVTVSPSNNTFCLFCFT